MIHITNSTRQKYSNEVYKFFIGIETNIDAFRNFYEFFATPFWDP